MPAIHANNFWCISQCTWYVSTMYTILCSGNVMDYADVRAKTFKWFMISTSTVCRRFLSTEIFGILHKQKRGRNITKILQSTAQNITPQILCNLCRWLRQLLLLLRRRRIWKWYFIFHVGILYFTFMLFVYFIIFIHWFIYFKLPDRSTRCTDLNVCLLLTYIFFRIRKLYILLRTLKMK